MTCKNCGAAVTVMLWEYRLESLLLGEVVIPDVKQLRCVGCEVSSVDYAEAVRIQKILKDKENEAISQLAIGKFVSANDAAKILDVTKQAFSKNPKIRNGFIISREMGDRTFYYLPSVMEFKENGDGRIDIGRSLGDLWSGGSLLHYSLSETSLQETSVRIEEVEISGGVYAR